MVAGGTPLTLTPAVIAGVQGEPATYTAAWSGLAAFTTYVGLVSYGDTGAFTAVQVTTGEAVEPGTPINTSPPTITGKPLVGKKLTAHPGEWDTRGLHFTYQWAKDGVDIPGATNRKYTVKPADQGGAHGHGHRDQARPAPGNRDLGRRHRAVPIDDLGVGQPARGVLVAARNRDDQGQQRRRRDRYGNAAH